MVGRARLVTLALLACAAVLGVGLRAATAAEKTTFTHDEAISYLAATCHQGEWSEITFGRREPYGRWVPASAWQRLLEPDRAGCLGRIAHDLSHEDIHPPLYWWLLHGWVLAVGVGPASGSALNILVALATAAALLALGRRVLADGRAAALAAAAFLVCPASFVVSGEARHYELLALASVLALLATVRLAGGPRRPRAVDVVLMTAAIAMGALTHYYFALVALGCAGHMLAIARARRATALAGLASIGLGYVLFALAHPGFLRSFGRAEGQADPFALWELAGRAGDVAPALAGFALPPAAAWGVPAYVAAAAVVGAVTRAAVALRRTRGDHPEGDRLALGVRPEPALFVLLVLGWLVAANIALFLAFVTPGQAMSVKHLSGLWPTCALALVVALATLRRRRAAAALAYVAVLAVGGTVAALGQLDDRPAQREVPRVARMVVPNVARGVLPRVLWEVPPGTLVFAADQRHLLEHRRPWLSGLEPGDIYVSGLPETDPRYGDDPRRAALLLALVAHGPTIGQQVPTVAGRMNVIGNKGLRKSQPRRAGRRTRR